MPRVILIDPCLDERWDQFVESHPWGWVCHLSGWKRALETAFSHMRGHYLALVDEAGQIRAGLPIFEVRSLITGNRLVSMPFATICDPLAEDQDQMPQLIDEAKRVTQSCGCGHLEIWTFSPHYSRSVDNAG